MSTNVYRSYLVDPRTSGRYSLERSGWLAGKRRRKDGQIEHGVWNRRTNQQVLICLSADEAKVQAALLNDYARSEGL